MKEALNDALQRFREHLAAVDNDEDLYRLQVEFLGRKGIVTGLRATMAKLPPSERKGAGLAFNEVKGAIEAELAGRREQLVQGAREREIARHEDLTAFPASLPVGTLHPVTQTRRALERIFMSMGFSVEDGPHVEHERYNFDELNFLPDHPARDEQDTFLVAPPPGGQQRGLLLRTHTSPVQVRTMLDRPPPIRIIAPGTTFRRDDDATHTPMFHQIEGLRIDLGVNMADLKATLYQFVTALFQTNLEVRFRPSYFPFVEPGAEFDMQCPFCRHGCPVCKSSGWIELGGAGMVHPAVLEAANINPEIWSGWAFGFGIDRMAMLLHDIPDLRLLFEGDIRVLEQFPC